MTRYTEEWLKNRAGMPKGALLTPHKTEVAQVKAGKVGKFKLLIPTEHQEQCRVIDWCNAHPIANCIFAIPNGSHKSQAMAAKFQREGLRKGVPDLFIPLARGKWHGLFIEMKRVKGSVTSPDQIDYINLLIDNGYRAQICHGADEAINLIAEYLAEPIPKF